MFNFAAPWGHFQHVPAKQKLLSFTHPKWQRVIASNGQEQFELVGLLATCFPPAMLAQHAPCWPGADILCVLKASASFGCVPQAV
jgi:hypothetical protein